MAYAGSQYHQGPGYLNDPLKPFLPPTYFCNEEQSVTLTCPEGTSGDPVTATVEAGELCGYETQELANAAALAQAQAEAEELREASPCESGNTLWGWGKNDYSSIGVGNSAVQDAPVLVGFTALEWRQISSGAFSTAGVKSDGSLWTWGGNFSGELGLGTVSVFPSTANNKLYPTRVGSGTDWVSVLCRGEHMLAIKEDGTLWAWGDNSDGELGLGDTVDRHAPTKVGTDTDWLQLAGGIQHVLALKTDGTIWATGFNQDGQLGQGNTTTSTSFVQVGVATDWAFIACGNRHSIAIKETGELWMWGQNDYGQFGNGTSGSNQTTPLQIGVATDWAYAAGGQSDSDVSGWTLAIKTDGKLYATGSNFLGQLGLGDTTTISTFTQVGTDADWAKVSCGGFFSTAIKTTGEMFGFGDNQYGQLGQGGLSAMEEDPIQMGSDEDWSAVEAAQYGALALRTTLVDPAPPPGSDGVANGGIYTEAGGNSIHRFNAPGTFTVYTETAMNILYCGGGGGGGGLGGGGGGEFKKLLAVVIPVGTYAVVVPHFALGAAGGEDRGEDGGTVSFNGVTAVGGGGGGALAYDAPEGPGKDGSSGGGGGRLYASPYTGQPGGNGTAGNDGGAGFTGTAIGGGGGGGGFGAVGVDAPSQSVGGAGGAGTSDSITGTATFYCAGGGGSGLTTGGAGGSSVGGHGSDTTTPATRGSTAGSGGGGSLGNFWPVGTENGDAAPGVVIISYPTPP